jgi:hypothetical protein
MKGTTPGVNETPGVIKVGRDKWAIGLDWYYTGSTEVSGGVARRKTKETKGDLFLIKKPNVYAIGSSAVGHKRGMPALALSLAQNEEIRERSFLGVFEIENSGYFYFIIFRDGIVDPHSDRIIDNGRDAEEEVREQIRNAGQDAFENIYVPGDWDIPDSVDSKDTLEVLLPRKAKQFKLASVSRKREILLIAFLLILAGVSYAGYTIYSDIQEREAEQAALAAQAEQRQIARQQAIANQLTYPPATWTNLPQGISVLNMCAAAITALPINPAGWELTSSVCNGSSVVETFSNAGGTSNWIAPFVNKSGFGVPSIVLNSESSATVTWPLDETGLPKWTGKETGIDLGSIKTYLISQFDELFQPITLTPPIHPQVTATKGGQPVSTPAPWLESDINIKVSIAPTSYNAILSRLPILVIDNVTYHPDDGSWVFSGEMYQNPPGPPPPLPAGQ